jgi:RHS repeat-associated protein
MTGSNACGTTACFSRYHFTGKERDSESGNDYFGARYYASMMGGMLSPDPTFLDIRRVFNPQRWNMYSYAINNPLTNIDPDGSEVISVLYPDYMAGSRGNIKAPTGHAGIVLVEKDGTTHYFEYGRYPNGDQPTSDGAVRNAGADNAAAPSVQRDASGNITQDSMNALLSTLSVTSGKGGTVDALVIPTTSAEDENILAYLNARQAENGNPNRQKYSLWGGHNCGSLACEALSHAGMKSPVPAGIPAGNWKALWELYPNATGWEYQPKEHVTHRIIYNPPSPYPNPL